jgi:transcriptional regulator with XRE-family HTH domain
MDLAARLSRTSADGGFPRLLRDWRQRRRMSQLDLALESGVSQRHVSFLESGRANPSRSMILQLSETLEVPLRDRNHWLAAAGFAPLFKARALDDPQMGQVMGAVRMMLTAHEPFPALALDRHQIITPQPSRNPPVTADRNRVSGEAKVVASSIGQLRISRVRRAGSIVSGIDPRKNTGPNDPTTIAVIFSQNLWNLRDMCFANWGVGRLSPSFKFPNPAPPEPFDAACGIAQDELRIETLFPADSATEVLLRGLG